LVYVEPRNHFLYKLLFGTALTLGIVGSANANYNPNQKPLLEQYSQQREDNKESEKISVGDTNHTSIKVTIIDSANKDLMPFVNVLITYNGEQMGGGTTDIDGLVTITIPSSALGKKLSLTTLYPGYHDYHLDFIAPKSGYSINIKMGEGQKIILGGPMIIYRPLRDPTHYSIHKGDTPLW
jgi:hypothetical protein